MQPWEGAAPSGPAPSARSRGPDARWRAFAVAVVVLSITLVGLVTAIVVVLVRGSGTDGLDPCVVGRWRVTAHRERVEVPGAGTVTFTGGRGALVIIERGGAARTDYGDGTPYTGAADGVAIKLELAGVLSYRLTTRQGTATVSQLRSTATARLSRDGVLVAGPTPIPGDTDPSRYTCEGDDMTQSTTRYTTTLRRQR